MCGIDHGNTVTKLASIQALEHGNAEGVHQCVMKGLANMDLRLQSTQPTSGGAVTVVTKCCANCVKPSLLQQWGPDLPILGKSGMLTHWLAGTAPHKNG